mmetsp:Transcript_15962/g.27201  ORF Transcript_15962/g.27201 Transcript_15962/m.27201 type:complete len:431 (-) Transcript_15962:24-1316(-)
MMAERSFSYATSIRMLQQCCHSRSSTCSPIVGAATRSKSCKLQTSSFRHLSAVATCRSSSNAIVYKNGTSLRQSLSIAKPRNNNAIMSFQQRQLSSAPSKSPSHSNASNTIQSTSNCTKKYFTTKTNQDNPCVKTELSELRAEIAQLSYLIKQTASQQTETQALSRRAEARAYIIENKLMDIQSHVVKIPALENVAHNLRQYLEKKSPAYVSDAIRKVNQSPAASYLTNKYTAWVLFGGIVLFWHYRLTMYQQTSEEIANVAAMTLQQDTLRCTIQETLTTVANNPATLASLSALFQSLISEERTEQQLIQLIVRALNSEGVHDAAISLLDVCFRNPELQQRAGEFLKVAARATVLDEGVQKSAGVGMQRALKSAVLPPYWSWAQTSSSSTNGDAVALEQQQKQGADDKSTNNGGNGVSPTSNCHLEEDL